MKVGVIKVDQTCGDLIAPVGRGLCMHGLCWWDILQLDWCWPSRLAVLLHYLEAFEFVLVKSILGQYACVCCLT